MARARNVKPSFFQHDVIGELPALARLLFIGMWTIADYQGCMEYRPKRMKAQLLPYDDHPGIEELVRNLEESGLIAIYTVRGTAYIKVVNFEKHQNPHKNERDAGSDNPDLDAEGAQVVDYKGLAKNPEQDGTTRADSLFPLPSSPFLIPDPNTLAGGAPQPGGDAPAEDPAPPTPPMAPAKPERRKAERAKEPAPTALVWDAYATAYKARYKTDPVRNAMVNGQLSNLVARLGAGDAPHVAAFYLRSNDRFYLAKGHSISMLLSNAEKLHTEWKTGNAGGGQKPRDLEPAFDNRDYGGIKRL